MGEDYFGLPNEGLGDDFEINDERKTRLKKIWDLGIERFVFEYDFGDGWEHVVEFEGVVVPRKEDKFPRCVKGMRHCPPEDCGGPGGYADFLKAIGDPKYPEHESMREWIGGNFDSWEFNLERVANLDRDAQDMQVQWGCR
jgi:hypothetical protein